MSATLDYRNRIDWKNGRFHARLENSRKSGDFTESADFLTFHKKLEDLTTWSLNS